MAVKNTEIAHQMNHLGKKGVPFFFVIDFEGDEFDVVPVTGCTEAGIFFSSGPFENLPPLPPPSKPLVFNKKPLGFSTYNAAFRKVKQHLDFGNTYLVNLTFPTALDCSWNLPELFAGSRARHKLLYKDRFVVFSPETFARIEAGKILSFPMKGTIDADIPGAEGKILANTKEHAEHNTIVDLIRNDLSMVASQVRVDAFRYVERIETNNKPLLQVSSRISGILGEDYPRRIGDIITTLLPAGSISGAPKKKTLQIIQEAEPDARGFFTGVFGVFDGRKLDSAVMIRFIEKTSNGLIFRSGGGITARSKAREEYQELIDKVYVPVV